MPPTIESDPTWTHAPTDGGHGVGGPLDPMSFFLAEWLEANGCTRVAMEATGVYWKPVWQVLAGGGFELVLANAAHVKTCPVARPT
jgi:hypothetical protein